MNGRKERKVANVNGGKRNNNGWKRNSTKDLMPSLEKSFLKLLFKLLKFSKKMMFHLKLLLL